MPKKDATRVSQTSDGRKRAVWRMVGGTAWVLRMDFPGETFTAYRSPSLVPVPEAEPGTVIFDSYPDFEEVRSRFPEHGDLWDALRRDYHATPPVAVTPDAEGAADV